MHSNPGGSKEKTTIRGCRYCMTMEDDYSCYTVVYLLKSESEAEQMIREYCAMAKTQCGRVPKVIRTDGDEEYSGASPKSYLAESAAEWKGGTYEPIFDGDAGVFVGGVESRQEVLGEAIYSANYLQNRQRQLS